MTVFNASTAETAVVADSVSLMRPLTGAGFYPLVYFPRTSWIVSAARHVLVPSPPPAVVETSAISDTPTTTAVLNVARAESAVAADVNIGTAKYPTARVETAAFFGVSDVAVGTATYPTARAETAAVADSSSGVVLPKTVAETAAVADTRSTTAILGVGRVESVAVADTTATVVNNLNVARAETAAVADVAVGQTISWRAETLAVADTRSATVVTRSTENLEPIDVSSLTGTLLNSRHETAVVIDAPLAEGDFLRGRDETVSALDATSVGFLRQGDVGESVGIGDSPDAVVEVWFHRPYSRTKTASVRLTRRQQPRLGYP